ncbi:PKD domain-containing protein [Flavobacterium sp.]|uniref:PKD domain-containing protein n=1 Tax=Flavobacterium sp. TaxID=239 RepID=UPI002FD9BDE9
MKRYLPLLVLLLMSHIGTAFAKFDPLNLSATLTGGTTVCQNSGNVTLTFTGSGGTAPYTFNYTINGVLQTPLISTGNSTTLNINSNNAGTFIYNLVSVSDSQPPNNPTTVNVSQTVVVTSPPIVNFSFSNNNTCSGTQIQFTSNVTGSGNYTYSWDFGDGSPSSTQQNPTHSFQALGCGTSTFNVTLTVTGGGCTVTRTNSVSVIQKPDINFTDVNSPFDPFSNCSNASSNSIYSITVGNASTSTCISSYSVNWGDGNVQNNITFPISHIYNQVGVYTMTMTATGSNGCISTKSYTIKNISNPLGGLNSPGSTQNLCAPTPSLQFSLSNWGTNSLDTTYTIDYGDGTPNLVLTQNQLIASPFYNSSNPSSSLNYPIPHIYNNSSCPNQSFTVSLNVTNACGTTPFTLGNISVIKRPEADFTSPPIACVNTSVLFTNTTIGGFSQNCNQNAIYTWNFGDGSPTVTTGQLSSPQNISHVFSNPGTYTVTLTSQNFCGITSRSKQICIESPLTPQFTVTNDTGCAPFSVSTTNTTNLSTTCSPPTYNWQVSYVAANCGTTSGFSFTGGTNASSANPSFNFTQPGTYTLTLTTTNSCGSATTTRTINVLSPPTVSLASISNACGAVNISPNATVNGCAPTGTALTYNWSFPGGTPSSSNSANPGTIQYATPGNYTVSLTVSNSCGASNVASQTFTISPIPEIINTISSQTICSGLTTTPVVITANQPGTTFTWTATGTVGITGFTASGTSNTIPAQTIITTGSSPGQVLYVVTPTLNGCQGNPFTYTVVVNPAPNITTQPASSTVCLGGNPTPMTVVISPTTPGVSYQWFSNSSNSNTGGALISGATTATYTPPTTTVGTIYYYVVVTLPSTGCNSLISNTGSVTVAPLPTITTQPTNIQSICIGGVIPALSVSYTGGLGTPTYQWFTNTSPSNSGGTAIAGATSSNYTPPVFNTSGTFYYYVQITLTGSGCGSVVSQVATVEVVPDPVIGAQPLASQTQCQGSSATPLEVTVSGGLGAINYQWFSNTSNNTTSGTAITGATSSSYTPPTTTVGTLYYYVIATQGASGCSVTSTTSQVQVVPAPTVSSQPLATQTICLGGATTTLTVATVNGIGTPTYQWFSQTNNSNTGGTAIGGATTNSFTPPSSVEGTLYYYVVISFSSGGCTSTTSATSTVTVTPLPEIGTQPTNTQSICIGGVIPALSVSYTGGLGTPTYQWFTNTSPSNSGGTAIAGATSSNYTPPVFNTSGTFYYYVQITLTGSGCGSVVSQVATVEVVPDPVIGAQPLASQTQCQGSSATPLEVTVSGGLGAINYQWFSNTSNNTTSGTAITGATSSSYTPPTTTVGTLYYYVIATQGASGCSVTSTTSQVQVVPAPTVSSQPLATQTICLGGATTTLTVATVNGIGTPTYQWFSQTNNSNTGGTAIGGATTNSFTPPSSVEGTLYYYVVISFSSGGCTSTTSATSTVTVTPLPEIGTQPTNTQSICIGGVIPALSVSYTGGLGTPTYQWFTNTSPSNSGGTAIAGATSSNYTPPVFNTSGTFYYYVQITLTGSGCGSVVSQVATVEVVPDPVIGAQPLASQTQCQGSSATPLEVTVSGGLGAINYQWFSNTSNNTTSGTAITGATSSSYTPPTTTVGTLYYYVIATQGASGCSVTSTTSQVQVVPAPTFTGQPQSNEVCEGGTLAPLQVSFTNGTGTASYQWFDSAGPIPGANSATYTPSNLISGEYYVVITFSSGGCTSITSSTAVITIVPLPEIDVQPVTLQTVCEGGVVPNFVVSFSGGTGNATYQWFSNSVPSYTGGTAIVGATNPSFTPSVFTTVGSYYFYVEISFDGVGCGTLVSSLAEVNVIPDPVVQQQPLPNQTLCQNTSAQPLSVVVSGGISGSFNYQWFVSTSNSIGSGTPIFGANSSEFIPPSDVAGTFYYYSLITQTEDSGCSVFSEISRVTVNLAPEVSIQPNSNIYCLGDVSQALTFSVINGVGTPNIQWFLNTTNSNSGGTPVLGASFVDFTPPTNQQGVFFYYAVINFPSLVGNCSTVVTDVVTITINQVPVVNNESITICSDNSFEVTPQNQLPNIIPSGTLYTWTVVSITPPNAVTGATANSNEQSSIGQYLINTTTNPAVVIYEVTPTSGDCVGDVFQVVVTVNPAISPNVVVANSSCFQINNGSILTNIVGGIPPYTITWTGPNGFAASTPSITNLAPGIYTLLIEDTGDCPYTANFEITEPDPIVISNAQQTDITCFGLNNGILEIEVTGGTIPYSFTWTQNNLFYSNEQNLSNLAPGTYEVTVTDANNCNPALMTFKISEPPLLEVSLLNQVNIECFGDATGAVTVQAFGGTISGDYTFSWNGPNGFTSSSQNIQNLFAGTYQLVVLDDNGCETSLTVVLTQSPEIIISYTTTPISCYGANDASLSVTLTGGVPPFQFTWNNLATSLNQNNLSAGDYVITVTDALGCVRIVTINIPEAPVFTINPIVNQISCFGANNGSINLNLTGGIAPVTLQWSDGSTAGLIRNNLPPGTYTATIADGTPCFIIRSFTIIEPQPLVVSSVLTQPLDCLNAASGAINLIVSGGTPPFMYQWSNGVTTEDLTGVVAGNYAVTVVDANGCTISGQFTLIRPNPLVVSVTTQTDADCETREVIQYFNAQASGGLPPYTYQWSSGTVSGVNNQTMQTTNNGMVILTVTDALGCSINYNVNVETPVIGNPNITTESFGYLTYGIYSVNDPIQFYGNVTGDYLNVVWDFGDGTFSNELNPVHTYELEREYIVTMTVTYPFGCTYVLTISLLVEKGYLLVIPSAFTPNNDSLNDTFRPVTRFLKSVKMDVYDSWGSVIYSETGDSLVGWDGKIKGIHAENGNYYAVVTAETFYGRIFQQNQTFVLIK